MPSGAGPRDALPLSFDGLRYREADEPRAPTRGREVPTENHLRVHLRENPGTGDHGDGPPLQDTAAARVRSVPSDWRRPVTGPSTGPSPRSSIRLPWRLRPRRPTPAWLGSSLSVLIFFLPVLWLLKLGRDVDTPAALAAFTCFWFLVLQSRPWRRRACESASGHARWDATGGSCRARGVACGARRTHPAGGDEGRANP